MTEVFQLGIHAGEKKKSLAEHKTRHNWIGENRLWKQLKMKKKKKEKRTNKTRSHHPGSTGDH